MVGGHKFSEKYLILELGNRKSEYEPQTRKIKNYNSHVDKREC